MDSEFQKRWRERRVPFNGVTLIGPDLGLSDLATELRPVVEFLRSHTLLPVYVLDDWHEHDGFVVTGHAIGWDEVESWIVDGKSVFAARTGDFEVRRAIFPGDYQYCLRFYVDCDEAYEDAQGSWDLTGDRALIESLRTEGVVKQDRRTISAAEYFDRRYGG